jgi:hypothetical protein
MVTARRGTKSAPPKSPAFCSTVARVSALTRVRDWSADSGSLNPMCPDRPMPSSWTSMPPARRMLA